MSLTRIIIVEDQVWRNEELHNFINKYKSKKIQNLLWSIVRILRKSHPLLDKKLKGKIISENRQINIGGVTWDLPLKENKNSLNV